MKVIIKYALFVIGAMSLLVGEIELGVGFIALATIFSMLKML